MCRAWCLGVWIAARAKSALGMPMASLVVPDVARAEDSQLGQQVTLPCVQSWRCQLPASCFLPEREGYVHKETKR